MIVTVDINTGMETVYSFFSDNGINYLNTIIKE